MRECLPSLRAAFVREPHVQGSPLFCAKHSYEGPRQSQAEESSCSRSKLHQTWSRIKEISVNILPKRATESDVGGFLGGNLPATENLAEVELSGLPLGLGEDICQGSLRTTSPVPVVVPPPSASPGIPVRVAALLPEWDANSTHL